MTHDVTRFETDSAVVRSSPAVFMHCKLERETRHGNIRNNSCSGWHMQQVEQSNDVEAVALALENARKETDRPSLIAVRTHIGFGSPHKQDTNASSILYVQALALPSTINTIPEATLNALAAHPEFGEALPENNDKIFIEFAIAGIDTDAVAAQLLEEGVVSFAKSWNDLLDCIASKSAALKAVVA